LIFRPIYFGEAGNEAGSSFSWPSRADVDAVAERCYAGIVAFGKSIAWNDMRVYLEERMSGELTKRPVARKLVR
jgi:hypothetical protein